MWQKENSNVIKFQKWFLTVKNRRKSEWRYKKFGILFVKSAGFYKSSAEVIDKTVQLL